MVPVITVERATPDSLASVCFHDILVVWVPGAVTDVEYQALERIARSLMGHFSHRIGMAVVIGPHAPSPSPDARRALNDIYRRLGPGLRAVAYVVLGEGFQAATARAAIHAMNLLARRPYETRVHSDLQKCAEWLWGRLPADPARGKVELFMQTMSAVMNGQTPEMLQSRGS